jgi:hypothetical protein
MAPREQNEPVEAGSLDGSDEQKKQGILVQVAADLPGHPRSDVTAMLAQRLAEAGIAADDAEISRLAGSLPAVETLEEAQNLQARDADGDLAG